MPDLTIAVAQSLPWPGELTSSIQHHVELAGDAVSAGATLVVFPELSLTGYDLGLTAAHAMSPGDPRLAPLQSLADAHNAVVVAGAPVLSAAGLHIGALILSPRRPARTYLKVHLHDGEELAFAPGPPSEPLRIGPERLGLAICADIAHPEHARAAGEKGCTIYAAGCFLTPAGYDADCGLLQSYAARYRLTVLMANFGGPSGRWPSAGMSAAWGPDGRLLAQAPAAGPAVVLARRTAGKWLGRVLHRRGPRMPRGLAAT